MWLVAPLVDNIDTEQQCVGRKELGVREEVRDWVSGGLAGLMEMNLTFLSR